MQETACVDGGPLLVFQLSNPPAPTWRLQRARLVPLDGVPRKIRWQRRHAYLHIRLGSDERRTMSASKTPLPLAGSERAPLEGAREIGPADPSESVDVTIRLRSRAGKKPISNADAFTKPIEQRANLSRKEFEQRHGADPKDIALVESFAREHRLTVKEK